MRKSYRFVLVAPSGGETVNGGFWNIGKALVVISREESLDSVKTIIQSRQSVRLFLRERHLQSDRTSTVVKVDL